MISVTVYVDLIFFKAQYMTCKYSSNPHAYRVCPFLPSGQMLPWHLPCKCEFNDFLRDWFRYVIPRILDVPSLLAPSIACILPLML